MVLLSTHEICFSLDIRKLNFDYALFTEVVDLIRYYKLVLFKHIIYTRECTQLDTYIYNSMVKNFLVYATYQIDHDHSSTIVRCC